jgi:acyl-CoA thioesterase I
MTQHIENAEKIRPFLDRLSAGEHLLLAALGDSNTCNAHFGRGGKQWPELLHQELRDHYNTQRILMINAGISGDSVREALARLDGDVLRFRPDLTVVCLGSNDANRLSDDEFRAGMDETLDRLEEAGSLLLLRTPTPIMEYEPAPEHLWTGDEKLRPKLDIIREIARERALAFVDTYAQWWDLESAGKLNVASIMHDAVHTNALGHQLVCRGLAPAFGMPGTFMWEREAPSS